MKKIKIIILMLLFFAGFNFVSADYIESDSDSVTINVSQDCKGSWTDTSVCSVTACGSNGVKQQVYKITTPASNGGNSCSELDGAKKWGTTSCSTNACSSDVDCKGDWKGCVNGINTYSISTPASGNGNACDYTDGKTKTCSECVASWTDCNSSGSQTYIISFNATGGATPCSHTAGETRTCTPTSEPTTTTGSISAYGCAIPAGSSECSTSASWSISNPVGNSAVTFPVSQTLSTLSSGSKSISTPRGSRTYYLYNNGSLLDSSTVWADCTPGTSWDSATSKCKSSGALPDIVANSVSTFEWFPIVGTSSDFYTWIDNLGTTAANNFTVLYQKATDVDGSGNATGVTDENTKSGVSVGVAGSGSVRSPYGTINFYTAGKNYIRICADKSSSGDTNGVIAEFDEDNNCTPWKSVTVLDHPTAPTVTGNKTFKKNTYQTFSFTGYSGVYTGGHKIRYAVDWDGNNTVDQYTDPFIDSGTTDSASYMNWTTDGDYIFKVATQDAVNGDMSSWTSYAVHVGDSTPTSITSFSADKYSIDFGKAVVLTWTSTGATSCSITATATSVVTPNLPASSNKSFKPTKTTNYTLNCTGPGGSDSKTLPNPVVVGKINPSYQEY